MALYATLASRIPEIIVELPGAVQDALEEGCQEIAEEAKRRVPIDQGDLQTAIHIEEIPGGFSIVAGDEDVFYGHIVEHGGTKTPAQPFLVPAFEAKINATLDLVEQAMENL